MSVEPSVRFIVPSGLTLMLTADLKPTLNQYPTPTPRPLVRAVERLGVVGMVAHGLQNFLRADAREGDAVGADGALRGDVFEPKVDGVHAELLGNLVEHRLGRERDVRRTGRAVGLSLGLVDDHVVAVDLLVGDVVGSEHAHCRRSDGRAGEGTGLELKVGLGGQNRPFGVDTDLDLHVRAGRRSRGLEHLLAGHYRLDRAARFLGQHGDGGFEVGGNLASEPAADLHRHDLNL